MALSQCHGVFSGGVLGCFFFCDWLSLHGQLSDGLVCSSKSGDSSVSNAPRQIAAGLVKLALSEGIRGFALRPKQPCSEIRMAWHNHPSQNSIDT